MESKIEDFVHACLNSGEHQDCFLVDLSVSSKGAIKVFLDGDEGITLEQCKRISRCVEASIDEAGLFGGKYSLEVSSPGVDRPLKMQRQYPQHVGRMLNVKLTDGTEVSGQLEAVTDAWVSLTSENGKSEAKDVSWKEIEESFVQISFKK